MLNDLRFLNIFPWNVLETILQGVTLAFIIFDTAKVRKSFDICKLF